jgi:hypothetical protein
MTKTPDHISNPEYQASDSDKASLIDTADKVLLASRSTETSTNDAGIVTKKLHLGAGDGTYIETTTHEDITRYELTEWLGSRMYKFEWTNDPTDTVSTVTLMDEQGSKTVPMNTLMFENAQGALDTMSESLKKPKFGQRLSKHLGSLASHRK